MEPARSGWRERIVAWADRSRIPAIDDDGNGRPAPSPQIRTAVAIGIAIVAGLVSHTMNHAITLNGVPVGDIGPPLVGLRHALSGETPYGIQLASGRLAQYPFTTMVVLLPLLMIPIGAVAPVFCALTSGLLAWGSLANGHWWRLLIFLSMPYMIALYSVQWSPLFAAALLVPALLPFAVAKPQLGLALLVAGRWTRARVGGAAALVIASLAIRPAWPLEWWRSGTADLYDARVPLLVFPGLILILSFLFIGSSRGRLLAAMSLIPQRFHYDQVMLFMLPSTWRQMLTLVVCSWLGGWWCIDRGLWNPASGTQTPGVWTSVVITMYLPALAMVGWSAFSRRKHRAKPVRDPLSPTGGPHSSEAPQEPRLASTDRRVTKITEERRPFPVP